jgi:hypothetical protein
MPSASIHISSVQKLFALGLQQLQEASGVVLADEAQMQELEMCCKQLKIEKDGWKESYEKEKEMRKKAGESTSKYSSNGNCSC